MNYNNAETIKENRLEIIESDKLLLGVCSAFARFTSINVTILRLIVLVLFISFSNAIILVYSALGILIPYRSEVLVSEELKIKNSISILIFGFMILLTGLLLIWNVYSINQLFDFILERINPFTLIVFATVLLINNIKSKEKEVVNESNQKKLTLSNNKIIWGVCGGIAEYLNISPFIVRLLWILFLFSSFGLAIIIYIALKFIIPSQNNEGI